MIYDIYVQHTHHKTNSVIFHTWSNRSSQNCSGAHHPSLDSKVWTGYLVIFHSHMIYAPCMACLPTFFCDFVWTKVGTNIPAQCFAYGIVFATHNGSNTPRFCQLVISMNRSEISHGGSLKCWVNHSPCVVLLVKNGEAGDWIYINTTLC